MEGKTLDTSNKLLNHIIAGLLSFVLIAVLLSSGKDLHHPVAATAFLLLFLVLIIGPATKLWSGLAKVLPAEFPLSWRGELGTWFAVLTLLHVLIIYTERGLAMFSSLASLALIFALFWALILAVSSSGKAIEFLGVKQWRWVHSHVYAIFYLVSLHMIDHGFLHHGHASWLGWLYLTMIAIVVVLQFSAFTKDVVNYRKNLSENKKLYRCPECGFEYKEKEWAEKCGDWCKEHKSCNLEITKHAVKQ